MKLFIALAFLAVASAMPEIKPIELPAPAVPTVATAEKVPVAAEVSAAPVKVVDTPTPQAIATEIVDTPTPVKVVDAPTVETTAETIAESIKIVDALTPEATAESIKVVVPTLNPTVPADQIVDTPAVENAESTVKVVDFPNLDAPAEGSNVEAEVTPVKVVNTPVSIPEVQSSQAEVAVEIAEPLAVRVINSPVNADVEGIHMMMPDPLSIIDISPALVSPDVMRRIAEMAENEAVNIGAAGSFAFQGSEPLDSIDRVKVVDSPINVLDAQMSPVVIVDSPAEEQVSFDNYETVKVVDLPQLPALDIPMVNWRGPMPQAQRPALPMFREVPREWLLRDRPQNMPPVYKDPMWR